MKPTPVQLEALKDLARCVGHTATLGRYQTTTIKALMRAGLIERTTAEPVTWAAASRGRVPFYRLTEKGLREVDHEKRSAEKWRAVMTANLAENEEADTDPEDDE